jgi:hypothetical protein
MFRRYQSFDLMDTDNRLVNSALVERDLLDQVMSTFESLIPNNFAQVLLWLIFCRCVCEYLQ